MCGIVGCVLKGKRTLSKRHEDVFFELLYVDALRGYDSTGLIGIEGDGKFHIAKEASEATFFNPMVQGTQQWKDISRWGMALIGHNRKATKGGVKDATAHPFVVDKTFAMVHNGTLYNHEALAKTEVDSEALAIVMKEAVEKENLYESIKETFGKVWGAYAIAAYNQKAHQVYLYRNKERPLAVMETEDSWWWASELGSLNWILTRNGYDFQKLKYHPILDNDFVVFDLEKGTAVKENLEPKKAFSPVSITGTTTTTVTGEQSSTPPTKTTVSPRKRLSKKGFKSLKGSFLGKRIAFWIEDYIELAFPRTVEEHGERDVHVFGIKDEWEWAHDIQGQVNLDELGVGGDIITLTNSRYTAVVEGLTLDDTTGLVSVDVADIKKAPLSLPTPIKSKEEKSTTEEWKLKLDYEDYLNDLDDGQLLKEATKINDLAAWQVALLGMVQRKRAYTKIDNENSTAFH